jgi:hypothetical protein
MEMDFLDGNGFLVVEGRTTSQRNTSVPLDPDDNFTAEEEQITAELIKEISEELLNLRFGCNIKEEDLSRAVLRRSLPTWRRTQHSV